MCSTRSILLLTATLGFVVAGCGDSDHANGPEPSATLTVSLVPDTLVIGDSAHLVATLTVDRTTADSIELLWDSVRTLVPGASLDRWIHPARTGTDSVRLTAWAGGLPAIAESRAVVTTLPPLPPLASLLASLDSVRATLAIDQPAAARLAVLAYRFSLAGQTLAQRLGTTFVYDSATQAYVASARSGAPADALRFVLYTVNSGSVVFPLVETGTADVSTEGTDTALRVRVRVIEQGDTVINYLAKGRLVGGFMWGLWVDAQARLLTTAGPLDMRVTGDLRTPVFGGYVSAGWNMAYPGTRADIAATVLSGSHTTVGSPRSLLFLVLHAGRRDSIPVFLRWDPSANLQVGSGSVSAQDRELYQVDAAGQVRWGVLDTVPTAAAVSTWSSLTDPGFGLPRRLNLFSSDLFEPVAFVLRSLAG